EGRPFGREPLHLLPQRARREEALHPRALLSLDQGLAAPLFAPEGAAPLGLYPLDVVAALDQEGIFGVGAVDRPGEGVARPVSLDLPLPDDPASREIEAEKIERHPVVLPEYPGGQKARLIVDPPQRQRPALPAAIEGREHLV